MKMEDKGSFLTTAIRRVVGKLRFYLGSSSASHKFKGTVKMLDLLEENLKLLHEKNLRRVSIERKEEMDTWLRQVKEATGDAEELVKDMEVELEAGESVVSDVMDWFHSDSSCLLKMKYTIGRLVSVCAEGESIIGTLDMDEDEDNWEAVQNNTTSLSPEHAYVVGRDKEIAIILEMILNETHFKAATSLENWEIADSSPESQKGWITDMLRTIDLSRQRQEDAEVAHCQKVMGNSVSVEYTLVHNDSELCNPTVIPIVGMSGVGKTTLAQLIFGDKRIQEHFQGLSAWIYFTDKIRKEELMTQIMLSLQPQQNIMADVFDLNNLHAGLQNFIEGKRFLLVLDGVFDEIRAIWSDLRSVLSKGAPGSVVLVTTQIYSVADLMGTTTPIFLDPLQYGDMWKLIKHHAFASSNQCTEALEAIGRNITGRLHGLPLAAVMIGVSLRNYSDKEHWDRVLQSWWWDTSNSSMGVHVTACFGVCYSELSAYLRQCLVYCSIFPRNYVFDKYQLIQMWIANGFVDVNNNVGRRSLEDVASEWFDELVNRRFLHQTIWKAQYVMHDWIRDFAIALASDEYCGVDSKLVYLPPNVRHLSLVLDNLNVPWADYNVKKLRSLLLFGRFSDTSLRKGHNTAFDLSKRSHGEISSDDERSSDISSWRIGHDGFILKRSYENETMSNILTTAKGLRLLNLYNMKTSVDDCLLDEDPITVFVKLITRHHMLPHLIHLRYLDFSYSGITEFPDALCSLCNLQVLGLRGCTFTQLPRSMNSLISLRHLHADADTIALINGIGELTNLQTLHEYRVKAEDGHRITELRDMRYIQGPLCISDLQRVANQAEATQANLFKKELVTSLEFKWDRNQSLRGKYNPYGKDFSQYNSCKKEWIHSIATPHLDVSESIVDPSDIATPHLAMEILESLSPPGNLQELKIFGYPGFAIPDWVGQLRYIRVIDIRQCTELQMLPPIGHLEHLRKLNLYELPSIKDINSDLYETSNMIFGSLEELSFESMVNWGNWEDTGRTEFFANLQKLQIKRCYNLKGLPFMALGVAIKVLSLSGCGSYSSTVSSYLYGLTCLTHLTVDDCSQKLTLPCQHLASLEYLHLSNCKELCFEGGILCLSNLGNLNISSCHIIKSSPEEEISRLLSSWAVRFGKEQALVLKNTILQVLKDLDKKGSLIHFPGSVAGLTKSSGGKRREVPVHTRLPGLPGTRRRRELENKEECVCVMQSLTDLSMDNLSLSPVLDNILCKLSALRSLCLYKIHKISVLHEQWLEQIKSLQVLEFSCCYLLRKLPSNLYTLSSLKKLTLQSCYQIHSIPSKGLPGNLKEFQVIDCSPILEARCQKEGGEKLVKKKKIGEWKKHTINEYREMKKLKYEEDWVQCAGELLKNNGEWLNSEEEDLLKNAVELETSEDVWLETTGEDWQKIAHIPYIRVNGNIIQNLYL